MYEEYLDNKTLIRQETTRLLKRGLLKKKDRCQRCRDVNPVVNHLSYDVPHKINFLCYRCHMFYHAYRRDDVPGSRPRLPEWYISLFHLIYPFYAFWCYWIWYPVKYAYRLIWPLADYVPPAKVETVFSMRLDERRRKRTATTRVWPTMPKT